MNDPLTGPSSTTAPPAEALPAPRPPRWAALALVLSGMVLMIVETPNLLFFLGLAFSTVGLLVWVGSQPSPRPAPSPFSRGGAEDDPSVGAP